MRLIGVEEELLVVDPDTGLNSTVTERALDVAAHKGAAEAAAEAEQVSRPEGPEVEPELHQQQIETTNEPVGSLADLAESIRRGRRSAGTAVRAAGAVVVAAGSSPLSDPAGEVSRDDRYERIVAEFGQIARSAVVCGMHVHVDVADREEAVAVIDRIRPWLPVLVAVSSNSPFSAGQDTGYASWRHQTWRRWPAAVQCEPFGDAAGYEAAVEQVLATGAALDRGMLYLDARPAEGLDTVEIRINDVCTDVDDAVLVAGLARGLVGAVARQASEGRALPPWRTQLLTASMWRASRYGLSGDLVDPTSGELSPAADVVRATLSFIEPGLEDSQDLSILEGLAEAVLRRGTGAERQRAARGTGEEMRPVMQDLISRTHDSWQE
jgi:carboxylate-amine ligase